jgi:hypothetical protein
MFALVELHAPNATKATSNRTKIQKLLTGAFLISSCIYTIPQLTHRQNPIAAGNAFDGIAGQGTDG